MRTKKPITLYITPQGNGTHYCGGIETNGKVFIMGLELKKAAADLHSLVSVGPMLLLVGFLAFVIGSLIGFDETKTLTVSIMLGLFGVVGLFFATIPSIGKSISVNALYRYAIATEKKALYLGKNIVRLNSY